MFSNLAFFEIEAWGDSEMAFLFKSFNTQSIIHLHTLHPALKHNRSFHLI